MEKDAAEVRAKNIGVGASLLETYIHQAETAEVQAKKYPPKRVKGMNKVTRRSANTPWSTTP